MRIDRRDFFRESFAAIVVAAGFGRRCSPSPAQEPGAEAPSVVDTHQHVWDLRRFTLPWLKDAGRLNRSYTLEDYAKAIAGLNVTWAVYVEVAVAPEQREAEADYVVELCRSKAGPTAAATIGGDPAAEGFRPYVSRFKGSPFVKGVRAGYSRGAFENKRFVEGVRLLGEFEMSFDLLMGSALVGESARLVEACPGTRFVLDHCGNPDVKWFAGGADDGAKRAARQRWEEGVARLADRPNVVCKISGVAESGEEGKVTAEVVARAVNLCLDRFGDGRVMFASNWPVCLKTITLAKWVEVLREVVRPRGEAFGRELFHGNAAKFYGL